MLMTLRGDRSHNSSWSGGPLLPSVIRGTQVATPQPCRLGLTSTSHCLRGSTPPSQNTQTHTHSSEKCLQATHFALLFAPWQHFLKVTFTHISLGYVRLILISFTLHIKPCIFLFVHPFHTFVQECKLKKCVSKYEGQTVSVCDFTLKKKFIVNGSLLLLSPMVQ